MKPSEALNAFINTYEYNDYACINTYEYNDYACDGTW
jgi:hypothetical protein